MSSSIWFWNENKNIEALYRGIPLVTTSVAAESIDLINNENAFITDKPEEFAECIEKLIESDDLWYKFSTNSRKIAEQKYTKKRSRDSIDETN